MGISKSFQNYETIPSAIISDGGLNTIPLWAVSSLNLTQTYHLPPIGSSGARAIASTHDDRVMLNGILVGPERYTWKLLLERVAEASKRGPALGALTGGGVGGLILITSMTIRTDMQIEHLSFSVSSAKRDVIDVQLTLAYMPLPSALGAVLNVASIGIGALADYGPTEFREG